MIDLEAELNAEQRDVVLRGDGPCLVLAGAGSGKTRTITFRVAYLLEKGIAPDAILLVTFTNKAAKEMIDRVQSITNGETRLPWSGTFHHVGYRLLRRYAPLLGYKHNFTVLDSEDSRDLLKLCLKQEGIDRTSRRFPSPQVIQSVMSYARNAEKTIADVLALKHPRFMDIADVIVRIASDYDRRKREANAMDFDDLLVNTYLLLLKSEAVRHKFSTQFQYVLVDEYQDTNKIQASIIKLLASKHRNLLVVGDDAQSIYSFRAADIENILAFEREYPDATIFRLETNYRSTPDILNVANQVIEKNVNQYEKHLKSIKEPFTKPEVHAFADAAEEAQFIATRILELRDEGVSLHHIAVLFRAAFHSQALEMELVKRDIPYEYRGGIRFFERAHVKDVLAYLRIVNNLNDTVAWSRVLNMQVGIGPAGAEKIIAAVKEISNTSFPISEDQDELEYPIMMPALSHLGSLLPARGQIGWTDFLQIWEKMSHTEPKDPSSLIHALLQSKYAEYVETEYPDYRERIADIEQLATFAARQPNLNRFLGDASLHESYAAAHVRDASTHDDEQVVLSTIHQAKGLEWEAVFLMNVAAGQFPSEASMREEKGIEEERRLFYVAVTRAKKYLYVSYPLLGNITSLLQGPSMFLNEIDRDLLDEHTFSSATSFFDPSDSEDSITYVAEDEPFPTTKRTPPKSFLKDIEDLI
ncbi:MAG TPA: ATP-dependent helicase [Candidatus Kapabacteria bacterium]|nr:ATP-dependent helicase [Candidatus Kapabacteria bacterium]